MTTKQQYVGESKLITCGFIKEGNRFVLYNQLGKQKIRVGYVIIDNNGYIKDTNFPLLNGELLLYHRW